MSLDTLMKQLAEEMEVESFATSVPSEYAIPLDEGLIVNLSEIPRGIGITCTLCNTPRGKEEEFYTQALLANLFEKGTEGCTLGLSQDGNKVILVKDVESSIQFKDFRDIVEDFMNSCEFWKEEVSYYQLA